MKDSEIQQLIDKAKRPGFDWNGTLDTGRFKVNQKDYSIITGIPVSEKEDGSKAMEDMGFDSTKAVFNDFEEIDAKTVGEHKAKNIKQLGIDLFLENDPAHVYWIKKANPKAAVLYINKTNYVVFSYSLDGFSYALRLKEEGNNVVMALLSPEEAGDEIKDEFQAEWEKKRWLIGEGLIDKYPAKTVFDFLMKEPDTSDYFIDFDFNQGSIYAEPLEKKGFDGLFPHKEDRELEEKRQLGQEMVKKDFPDLSVPDEKEFKKVKEALDYITETQKIYVVKANDDDIQCFLPQSFEPDKYLKEVTNYLDENVKGLEKEGFILQERIDEAIELTPEALYWKGKPLYVMADIEYKKLGADNSGPMTGCSGDLNFPLSFDSKAVKFANQPYYKTAEERKLSNFMDASMLIDPKDDKAYFGEFCPARKGYNSFLTEMAMLPSVSQWFESVRQGINPFLKAKAKYAASLRIFNLPRSKSKWVEEDLLIQTEGQDIWLFDAKKKGNNLYTAGVDDNLAIVTGSGNSPEEAVKNTIDNLKNINVKDMYWRGDLDESKKWFGLLTRHAYLEEKNWL